MAGYYDPNKDYSKAISEAKAAGKDTSKLEAERQNKINDKYGGVEPTMYGSDKTYSQLSGSNGSWQNQDAISNAIVISNSKQNDSIKQQMEQAAQAGDWDKVGSLTNGLAVPDGRYGGQDMAYANQVFGEIAKKYGYNARDYYNQQYDKAYGAGSSAVFDATGGAVKTADQWNQLTGGAALPTTSGSGIVSGSSVQNAGGDAYQYLKDMYDANIRAQQAALKSAYDQNVLEYQAKDSLIAQQAQQQRNQAAAQNELQRMYMNEMGIMQGLNTGATGQMALAQSAALQGAMADIGVQEQQSMADSELARAKLQAEYSSAVNQAIAKNDYDLANALYQEYVRQDTMAQQKAAAALEQANWLAKFNYQQAQDALDQQNWQAQFDYQKQQDDLNYQLALMKLNAANTSSSGTKKTGTSASSPGTNESTQRVVVPNSDTGIQVKPLDYSTIVKNSEAGNYGPKYGLVLGNVQVQLARGADLATISDIIKRAVVAGDINNEGADTILQAFGY